MRRAILCLAILFSFLSFHAAAQDPVVTLGDVPASSNVPFTTSEVILKNPRLVTSTPGCKIIGYNFSITVGNKYWGPFVVKGPQLTKEIIDRIKETQGPGVSVYFDDIQVMYRGKKVDVGTLSVRYDQ